jgi:hypothetical protein
MTRLTQNRHSFEAFWPFFTSNGDIRKSMCIVGGSVTIEKNRGFSSKVQWDLAYRGMAGIWSKRVKTGHGWRVGGHGWRAAGQRSKVGGQRSEALGSLLLALCS